MFDFNVWAEIKCPFPLIGPVDIYRSGHRTHEVGEVSGCRVNEAVGKRLFPGSGDLMMQITEKRQFPPSRPGIQAAKELLVEFGRLRLTGLIGPINR